MSVLAIIPARAGSKGIPDKNTRQLGDRSLIEHAIMCAYEAKVAHRIVTTDIDPVPILSTRMLVHPDDHVEFLPATSVTRYMKRPPELATDETPMIDVVKHVLANIPGPEDQIVVLLQPTQPFRRASHVTRAWNMLNETGADSVVSVVQLPATHNPEVICVIDQGICVSQWKGRLEPYPVWEGYDETRTRFAQQPTRRQDIDPVYRRDGTVYCFRRRTVAKYGDIYGDHVRPLIIPPEDSCELDTLADWAAVERRWSERENMRWSGRATN